MTQDKLLPCAVALVSLQDGCCFGGRKLLQGAVLLEDAAGEVTQAEGCCRVLLEGAAGTHDDWRRANRRRVVLQHLRVRAPSCGHLRAVRACVGGFSVHGVGCHRPEPLLSNSG